MVYHGCISSVVMHGIEMWGESPHALKVFLVQNRADRITEHLQHIQVEEYSGFSIFSIDSILIFKVIMSKINYFENIPAVGAHLTNPTRHDNKLRPPQS